MVAVIVVVVVVVFALIFAARTMNSFVPTSTDPTGAQSPFDKQNVALSASRTSSATGVRSARGIVIPAHAA